MQYRLKENNYLSKIHLLSEWERKVLTEKSFIWTNVYHWLEMDNLQWGLSQCQALKISHPFDINGLQLLIFQFLDRKFRHWVILINDRYYIMGVNMNSWFSSLSTSNKHKRMTFLPTLCSHMFGKGISLKELFISSL